MAICGLNRSRRNNKCEYTLNQVKDLWFVNISDILEIGYTYDDNGCKEVDYVDLKPSIKPKHTYHIEPMTNSASFTDELTVNDNAKFRTHTITFSLQGDYDAESQCDLDALSLGEFVVVAQLANGNAVMLGNEFVGLKSVSAENVGGASASDFSGFNIEMQAEVNDVAIPLTSFALNDIKDKAASEHQEETIMNSVFVKYSNGSGEIFEFEDKRIPSEKFMGAFESQSYFVTVEITDGIDTIGDGAFQGNETTLTKVILPKTLVKIGQEAFGDCVNISEIIYEGNEAEWTQIEKSISWDKGINSYNMIFMNE